MTNKVQIGVSVICMDPLNLEREIQMISSGMMAHGVPGADFLHLDVMDNLRVPRFGMSAEQIACISKRFAQAYLDVHLMVADPLAALSHVRGAHSVSFHPEENNFNRGRIFGKIIEQGQQPGVALNWPYDQIVPGAARSVTLMGCYPGVLGGPAEDWTDKLCQSIQDIRAGHPDVFIQVDGGVRWDTVARLVRAGAHGLICGSATVYSPGGNAADNLKRVRELADV